MRNADVYSSVFWFAGCVWVCFHSVSVGLGTLGNPGPGFLFFWSAIATGAFSIAVFISALRPARRNRAGSEADAFVNVSWTKMLCILIPLILYAVLLHVLGYLLATFLLMASLLYSIEVRRAYWVLLVAGAASLLSYAVFAVWLGVRLPKGWLGF